MRSYSFFIFLAILATLLVSCTLLEEEEIPTVPVPAGYPSVDPLFREFYDQIGGTDVLGPAISDRFSYEGLDCQFTSAALMVHDPQSVDLQRFRLAPIGLRMGIIEPPVAPPEDQSARYIEGHVIYDQFLPLYEKIGGGLVAGKPLTELHFNPTKRRYEQYFENIGFYILEQDSANTVRLLAYGAWYCPHDCVAMPADSPDKVYLSHHTAQEFAVALSRLGPTFTGFPISDEYVTPDGYQEQVFENVVMVADPNQPGGVFLRAVPERLGYLPESPVEPQEISGMIFFPTRVDGKGYHIPTVFNEYIAQHGGQEIFGHPIDQYRLIKDNVFRQCYLNVCLEEHTNMDSSLRVRPSPLGYPYKLLPVSPVYPDTFSQTGGAGQAELQQPGGEQDSITSFMPSSDLPEGVAPPTPAPQLSIQIWVSYPMVGPDEYQEISVTVYQNDAPLAGVVPDLYLTLPDNTIRPYRMAVTGNDGYSRLIVEPIKAQPSTVIPYEVCVSLIEDQTLCVKESYLIWQAP